MKVEQNIPLNEMTQQEILTLIKSKYPDIEQDIRRRFIGKKSEWQLEGDNNIRWKSWLEAVKNAMIVPLGSEFIMQEKVDVLNSVYNKYIIPYITQYSSRGRMISEAYLILLDLCETWSIPEEQILRGLKFQDTWSNNPQDLSNLFF